MALAGGPQTELIRLKQKHNKMKQTNKSHLAVLLRECENHLLKKKLVHSRHSYRSPPLLFLPPSIPLFSPLSMSPSFVDTLLCFTLTVSSLGSHLDLPWKETSE